MKTNKFLYGFLAFVPLIGLVVIFTFMGMMLAEAFSQVSYGQYVAQTEMPYYLEMMVASGATGLVGIIGLVTYVMHCLNNIHITQDKRTVWIVVLVMGGMIGMIIYFFTWISKEDQLNAKNPVQF